uniref:Uncharacterized protein n=1 Tax=Glossina brevipalpis TaxID=37001 RepID=A0A1A9W4Q3_9MUSC
MVNTEESELILSNSNVLKKIMVSFLNNFSINVCFTSLLVAALFSDFNEAKFKREIFARRHPTIRGNVITSNGYKKFGVSCILKSSYDLENFKYLLDAIDTF